eukprot:363836-Chlamydomonas_euryale.AAC.12
MRNHARAYQLSAITLCTTATAIGVSRKQPFDHETTSPFCRNGSWLTVLPAAPCPSPLDGSNCTAASPACQEPGVRDMHVLFVPSASI